MTDPRGNDAKVSRETGGWSGGAQPGIGRGAELDRSLGEGAGAADPALDSAVPGFVDRADTTEQAIEGQAVSEARNAIEDLPRQG